MPKSTIINMFQGPNISHTITYTAIGECEEGIPSLNLRKKGRRGILRKYRTNKLMESTRRKVGLFT